MRVPHLAGGQVARTGVDRCRLIEEGEGGLVVRQGQVGLIEGFHRADVFPVALEDVALQVVARRQGGRNDLLAEVGGLGVAGKQIKQQIPLEHVDPHRGQKWPASGLFRGEPQGGCVHPHGLQRRTGGFLTKLPDAPIPIGAHQAKATSGLLIHRKGRHGDGCPPGAVSLHKGSVIHAVELIA